MTSRRVAPGSGATLLATDTQAQELAAPGSAAILAASSAATAPALMDNRPRRALFSAIVGGKLHTEDQRRSSDRPDGESPRGWHSRGYLPHFDAGKTPQSITFRLAGSIPAELLRQWREALKLEA